MRMAGVNLPAPVRMTAFQDDSSIRPGFDDLFFSRNADQNPFIPPPRIIEDTSRVHVPIDLLVLAIVVIGVVIRVALRSAGS